ncbi:hypothetical protein NP493_729g01024 [Ridgeia piscesae]|uniref:Golgin subfamily A conserved domain-containing protein n=1 Tax=Ridgeia piscesae TaxID=27915 RepID=A0AAD9KQF5_RIDPI|nr:hypothetical protein NP493_729g01024 [Ridgeia piscesae]
MADAGRKEKLAAAKKKLKQFQKSSRTPSHSPVPRTKGQQNGATQENRPASLTNTARIPNNSPHQAIRRDDQLTQLTSGTAASPGGDAPLHSTQTTPTLSTVAPNERLTASTEQLQQMSRQINGLISQVHRVVWEKMCGRYWTQGSGGDKYIHWVERGTVNSPNSWSSTVRPMNNLNKQLQNLKNHNVKLQNSLETERKGFDEKLKREIGALKEQLQTIGILVAEKTELQSSLNQKQKTAEQRQEEVEELSGRLKASRQRVAELEKSFTSASSLNQKNEKSNKDLSKDVDRLKLELYKLNKSNEEFQQQTSELQGKLHQKISECGKQEDQLILLRGQLEMAQLNNQQLQSGGGGAVDTQQVEQLLTEKAELQTQLKQYDEAFQKVSSEREQIAEQYQQYVDQLTQQSAGLQAQIGSLVEERNELLSKQEEFSSVIAQLQNTQDTTVTHNMKAAGASEASLQEAAQERDELTGRLNQLEAELGELRPLYEAQVADNAQLSRLVGDREAHIEELEMQALRLSETQVDSEKLLEHMQSDKTALSRAIAQNRELKTQLAELQNGFVKMSNENMELMTQLQKEQHISKELASRLAQQEEELKEIRSDVGAKEQELQRLRLRLQTEETEGGEELEQRLQQFQQQTPLLESLQRELSSAQASRCSWFSLDAINALTNQNSELKSQLLRDVSNNNFRNDADSSAQVEQMSVSIRQLEMERNEMIRSLENEEKQRQVVQKELDELRSQLASQTPATLNGDVINKAQFEALQHAMKQLEVKYTRVMREQAELSDSREQLEHIVMQLQGETETIGEYVALYQQQRFLLKQRQLERDDYVSQMARDHQHMQDKLAKLQTLVVQLLDERHRLHTAASATTSPTLNALANHTPHITKSSKHNHKRMLDGTVNSDDLEDWPGSSSSSGDESDSVPVIGGAGGDNSPQVAPPGAPSDIPLGEVDDRTAQQIMLLLSEIGNSNVAGSKNSFSHWNYLQCNRCVGRMIVV